MKKTQTPNGLTCTIPEPGNFADDVMIKSAMRAAKGSWQREVLRTLLRDGYVIGYKPTGGLLRGKARQYKSHYDTSMNNLMQRLDDYLVGRWIVTGEAVGPKGAFGYRLDYY